MQHPALPSHTPEEHSLGPDCAGWAIAQLSPEGQFVLPTWLRRLIEPAELRRGFVLTIGLERSVFAFTRSQWADMLEVLARLPTALFEARMLQRLLLGEAVEVVVGRGGRIEVPEALRRWAGLRSEVLVMAVGKRFEFWDPDRWKALEAPALRRYEELAEALFRRPTAQPRESNGRSGPCRPNARGG